MLLNQYQAVIPPTEKGLIMSFPNSMMYRMLSTASSKSERQDLIVAPGPIHPAMNLDQQRDEEWYEEGASQDMTADDVQGEVGKQNQGDSLNNGEVIRDLRVDLGVCVMGIMNPP